jgi:sigma-B regulation protein RsbU (phosphoserine phosphatase)
MIDKNIQQLIHHLTLYSEMIYSDALLFGNEQFAEYFKLALTESLVLQRLVISSYAENEKIMDAAKDEVARSLFLIRHVYDRIPVRVPYDDYVNFEPTLEKLSEDLDVISTFLSAYFQISPSFYASFPIHDIKKAADKSLESYFVGIPEQIKNNVFGRVLIAGVLSHASQVIQPILIGNGFHLVFCHSTKEFYEQLNTEAVDVICFDCSNSVGLGMQILKDMKENPLYSNIPIFICGTSYTDQIAMDFISNGAMDYFVPGKSRRIMVSRVKAAVLESKGNYFRQLYVRALEMNQRSSLKEKATAVTYVAGLLPQTFKNEYLKVDWTFLPSQDLGGDIFTYDWLDKTHFRFCLVDVSGHGLEACLFSVSIMNLIAKKVLGNTDYRNPATVLKSLNNVFDMEEQHNMFFTAWYGVYDTEKKQLIYSSAGSSDALLFEGTHIQQLSTENPVIGIDPDSEYSNNVVNLGNKSRLFLFSDGIHEITKVDSSMMTLKEFTRFLALRNQGYTIKGAAVEESCTRFARSIEAVGKSGQFEDDVSLLDIIFY